LDENQLLTGWGRTPRSTARVLIPSSPEEIDIFQSTRGHLARGLGRSYGDAALNAGGIVWDTTALDTIEFDDGIRSVRLGAGVSYDALLKASIPKGMFPPVTPGTKWVTIGGAIAADVHGKNHHLDGSIGNHIESITMLTGTGEVVIIGAGDELFAATLGGMGLTGIILEARLRMFQIAAPLMEVDTYRTDDLFETMEALEGRDADYQYSVAWVDLAHSSRPGRGVVTLGDHPANDDKAEWKEPRPLIPVPDVIPNGIVNRSTVRAFNELWFRKAPRERHGELQTIDQFFYPLDLADRWNRVYGRAGFIQYQIVIPFGREDLVEDVVRRVQAAPAAPALVVLKRLGEGNGMLSFPIPGWTLAIDFPADRPDLGETLHAIDEDVTEAGGRVYLVKDSRMRPVLLPVMYPELDTWREIADKADPMRLFRSDLDRRLGLRGH
jgi:decaprenylphospho-beta-D-ribofuranose 2-oxidase